MYDSISNTALLSWRTCIYSTKANQQLQGGGAQITHGPCQQLSPTKSVVVESEVHMVYE
jgi:hypothetical protein